MHVRRAVVAVAAAAFAIAAPLGVGAAASSSGVTPTTGTIEGYVHDNTGYPALRICVAAYGGQDGSLAYPQITDANGFYQITGVEPGTYSLVYDPCDTRSPNLQPQYYGGSQSSVGQTLVEVRANAVTELDTQELRAGGSILLYLTDSQGHPLPGVLVQAAVEGADSPDIENQVSHSGRTDGDGAVVLNDLLPVNYELLYESCPQIYCAIVGYYAGTSWQDPSAATPVAVVVGEPRLLSDSYDPPTPVASTTTMTAQPVPSAPGQQVTFTATVTAADGSVPTGEVRFSLPSTTSPEDAAWVQLDAHGKATYTSTQLPLGTHFTYAYYPGVGLVAPSEGGAQITVQNPSGEGTGGGTGGGGAPPAPSPVSGTVGAGGSLSSDPAGTTPNASDPLVVGVTSPNGGTVSIDKTAPDTQLSHYRILNVGATITAPAASTANPLKLSFQVYDGSLPVGAYASDLTVFRDGAPVAACAKPGVVSPDPCVTSSTTTDGVTTINVLSSHASTWDVEAAQVGRVAGADRVATAAAIALDTFPNGGASAAVLARADDFPDALVGAPLAAAKNAPLLLTQGASLPTATADALAKVLAKGSTVYVLGGPKAVPATVAAQLSTLGYQVVRYAGGDRYATAVAVADALGDPSTVLLATGANFPDALAAGPAASHLQGAVLLTNGASLPSATSAYLAAHAATVYAVGGPAAKADSTATAIVGVDRYVTAADLATRFFAAPTLAGVATGTTFPDALAGSAQLAHADAPLLLATPTSVPGPTGDYLASVKSGLNAVHLYGGANALSDKVDTELRNAL